MAARTGRLRRLAVVIAIAGLTLSVTPEATGATARHVLLPHAKPHVMPVRAPVGAAVGSTFQFPSTPVEYWGGPVLRTNETYVVFWDPDGALPQHYRDLVVQYLQDVAHDSGSSDNVYSVLNQYDDTSGSIAYQSTFVGSITDTRAFPSGCPAVPDFPECFTDAQLRAELDDFLFTNGVARPANRAFLVVLPEGVNTCADLGCADWRFCGYHSSAHGEHGDLVYANLPWDDRVICQAGSHPNGDSADDLINVLSHEHREIIDDPLIGFATDYAPPLAWVDSFTGEETSDKCAFYFGPTQDNGTGEYNQVINGHQYLLQTEWSNALAADDGLGCVQNGSDTAPTASFTTRVTGPTLTVDGRGSSDADAGDAVVPTSYLWDFGDGAFATGPTAQHKYRAAGNYPVSLRVTDGFGASDLEMRTMRVANPSPVPLHGFSGKFNVHIEQFVEGFGHATGLGNAALASFGYFTDSSNFPYSFDVFVPSGLIFSLKNRADELDLNYSFTMTDVADPPAGTDYRVTGAFDVVFGYGIYNGAVGSGTVSGSCVSAFDRNDADCALRFDGTVGAAGLEP